MHTQMRTFVLFTFVAFLACTASQSLQDGPDARGVVSMLEIRKVNRPFSSSEHNVKIVLSQHQPLQTLDNWSFLIERKNKTRNTYSVMAEDPYQTEVEFEADLTNGAYVYIKGKDSGTTTLIESFSQLHDSFLSSRVARVGTTYKEEVSSLRVWPGDMTDVTVGSQRCQKIGAPCYYLLTSLPRNVTRCVTNYNSVEQCDEFITEFREINKRPVLNVSNGTLTVQVTLELNPAKIEAVVFDPQDPNKIFSPENYECQSEVNQGVISCQQELKDTSTLRRFRILLVALNEDGFVLESRMELYEDDSGSPSKSSTGVIVGSVVGGVCVAALLVGAAVFVVKKRKGSKENPSSQGVSSSGYYDVVSTQEPSLGRKIDA